jgi:steroid delta-isomerase-like uncharacterized protein
MSVEKNKASLRRFTDEIINKDDLGILPEFTAANVVLHSAVGTDIKGLEGIKQFFKSSKAAFPDWHDSIENLIAEGDMVAAQCAESGTFKHEFMGLAPTGKAYSIKGVLLVRYEGGKIAEAWSYYDMLSLCRQLGIPMSFFDELHRRVPTGAK